MLKNNNHNHNNGLITKIWGPPLWTALHSITFGYPINPTLEQQHSSKQFFYHLGDVMPCVHCRTSYKKFIEEQDTLLEQSLNNRESLVKWLYNIHNKVNRKLNMNYNLDYNTFIKKYENYRAKSSFVKQKIDNPFINDNLARQFKKIADKRGIDKKNNYFWNILEKQNNIIDDELHDLRNNYCNTIKKYMKKKNIPSIEQYGQYKGQPTELELKLLLCKTSNLSEKELIRLLYK